MVIEQVVYPARLNQFVASLFFSGLNIKSFQEEILKLLGEIIEGDGDDYDYIFEVCSLREIIFKN